MPAGVLKELANIARPHFLLSLNFCDNCERSPLAKEGKCSAHLKCKKGDLKICSLVSITFLPRKNRKNILPDLFSTMTEGQGGGTVSRGLSNADCA